MTLDEREKIASCNHSFKSAQLISDSLHKISQSTDHKLLSEIFVIPNIHAGPKIMYFYDINTGKNERRFGSVFIVQTTILQIKYIRSNYDNVK